MSFTVTATQAGGTHNGMALCVKVLTGAAAIQNGTTASSISTTTPDDPTFTPAATGSWVYGAVVNGSSSTAYTPASGTTFEANVSDTTNTCVYGAFRTTSTTTSGTPITVGATAPTGTAGFIDEAIAEILAASGQTLAESASAPAVASTFTATTVSTAAFAPPAGSLLVAMVATDTSGA
jgi:hypothetical protein